MILLRDGLQIGYDDVGSGLPIVFLHGFPHDRRLWIPQLGPMVDRCRSIAPDLRGFGETRGTGPTTIDRYADDIRELLDGLEIPRAVICGLSMGGYTAFAFWRRHPTRVRALVLADTKAAADNEEGREKRVKMIALARERGSSAVADSLLAAMVGKTTREKQLGVVEAIREMMVAAPVDGIVGACEAMMKRPDSTPTLATIDVPTLVIVGEEDAITPPKEAQLLHQGIRGSELVVLEQAGHCSNIERPAAFNHVLSEFLSRLTYA